MSVKYSVVVPVKNEEDNLPVLIKEIEPVMELLGEPWELICIDDGSTDQSLSLLKMLQKQKDYLKILSFTKNFGQSSAFDAGFKTARGSVIITLDGDGQNDPRDIPNLLDRLSDHDLVCGWRAFRRDTSSKRWISRFSNFIRSRLCKDGIHDTGCSLKVFRKEALNQIKIFHGMHRFLPALFKIEGFSVMEMKVNHRARRAGKSKYHIFNRNLGPVMDMFVVFWMRKKRLRYRIKERH